MSKADYHQTNCLAIFSNFVLTDEGHATLTTSMNS